MMPEVPMCCLRLHGGGADALLSLSTHAMRKKSDRALGRFSSAY